MSRHMHLSCGGTLTRCNKEFLPYLFSLPNPCMRLYKVLERMDVFTKFHDEDKIQTSRGASMALFSWVLVLVLLCSEAYEAFLVRFFGREREVFCTPCGG